MRTIKTAIVVLLTTGITLIAVTFGEPDGTAHPYVGTLLFEQTDGFFSCSGTMLSPTIMLTAGHCTSSNGITNLNTWVKTTPTISFADALPGETTFPLYLNNPAHGWVKGVAIPHPQFDDFSQFPLIYDVGVIVLDQALSLSQFGTLPPEGFLATVKASDNQFTVVGYGVQGFIKPFARRIYSRYRGTVRLIELNSAFDGGQTAKFTNNPGIGGGTCFGDSGGPIFFGNTNIITATVSFGITPCIGTDYNFRIDTQVALDFIHDFVP
jgi:hypothetical protein